MVKNSKQVISIFLERATVERLKRIAEIDDRSMSSLARRYIEEGVERDSKRIGNPKKYAA